MKNEIVSVTKGKVQEYLKAFGLANTLTVPEQNQFIEIAQAYQLNPFKKEIYCVPYMKSVKSENGDWKKERALSIITGYETYIKRADRSGKLNGWKAWTEGKPCTTDFKACIEIHRKGWEKPFYHEVYWVEYSQENKMWKEKPVTMIKKTVIGQGFRLCFSDELGGIPYTSEEFSTDEERQTAEQNLYKAEDAEFEIPVEEEKPLIEQIKNVGSIEELDALYELVRQVENEEEKIKLISAAKKRRKELEGQQK
jgi:phage recombination protein Bet